MGEYAEEYFRHEVKSMFGFDPGPQDGKKRIQGEEKVHCKVCSKRLKKAGLNDHMRDKHGSVNPQAKDR